MCNQWFLPDGTLVFDENFEIPFNQNGAVGVTIFLSNNCFTDNMQQVFVITDVTDSVIDKQIYIYPNPTKNTFTLETELPIDELYLYNVLGHCVLMESNLSAGSHSVDIQNFVAGNYFLKIHIGNRVVTKMVSID